jgi:hypothetical protein
MLVALMSTSIALKPALNFSLPSMALTVSAR